MTYLDKLKSEEWRLKREVILNRDKFTCSKCKNIDFSKKWVETYDEEGNLELYFYNKDYNQIIQVFGKCHTTMITELEHGDNMTVPIMNVHHKKYIISKEPWEYDNDDLITLCSDCHRILHQTEKIPLFDLYGRQIVMIGQCSRCEGYGFIPKYSHVQGGICFSCWGEGIDIMLLE